MEPAAPVRGARPGVVHQGCDGQATGPEPEAKAASKLVFSSENAVRGELLVCFGEEAVAGIESSVMQVTRSGGVATVRASPISTPCSAASG